jgi:hypothetical protein
VAEALAPNARHLYPQFGQAVDRWVTLLHQQGTLIPLERALETMSFHWNLDGSPEDTQAWQTYVEAGSFVRWIVESRGWEVFWRFHQSRSIRAALGAPVAEVEREWPQAPGPPERLPSPAETCWHTTCHGSGSGVGTSSGPICHPTLGGLTASRSGLCPEMRQCPSSSQPFPKWSGVWDGILAHVLVLEEIAPPRRRHLWLGQSTPVAHRPVGLGARAWRIWWKGR